MLHTKFHFNRPIGSREKDFLRVFIINGHGGHHVTQIPQTNFHSPTPWRLYMNLTSISLVVSEEKMLENVDGWTTADDECLAIL